MAAALWQAVVRPVENGLQDKRFRKHNRLLKSADFQLVYQRGFKVVTHTLIFRVIPSEHQEPRIGLAISRKVGKAVKRNLIKRRTREAFREKKASFKKGFDIVVSPRRGILDRDFQDYLKSFDILLKKINRS
ncbi:ribonuclease P protein component [Acanthopleuribacter pedis]|uniref:ribonuclease P protein component n=1 Tax=Acanthopleuribacter pedis TaxID=442870 RepID=UPI00311CBE5E